MKILYHSKGNIDELSGYAEWLRNHLADAARDDTEIEYRGTEKGGSAKGEGSPITADDYRFFVFFDAHDVARNAVRAPEEGFDAVAIGNILDPALRELRSVLDIPVLGIMETNLLVACMSADQVGVVTLTPRWEKMIEDNLRTYQFGQKVAALDNADITVPQLEACFNDDEAAQAALLDEFEDAVGRCVDEGAEIIIPGGGAVSAALSYCGLTHAHGVKLMDEPRILLKMTEVMVDLYAMGATETSGQGTFESPTNLEELLAEYADKL